jgi:dTDP-4-amino-4,6-dideoxygalactose transaminase
MTARIRIAQPQLGPVVEALVLEVLRSGRLSQGPMVARFEELCAEMAGTRHAIAVCNGTVALEAALQAAGVGAGDEVITTPFTFAATLNAILRRGAVARFADITDDFTIDPAHVDRLIGPRTRAIIPVHLYGLMAAMPPLAELARAHSLAVIEDAAQAHGASDGTRRAGGYGVGCFSFYATKNVTTGEGGCVVTNDDELAASLRLLRNQGMRERYEYVMVGENWRMTDVAAAIAIPQLQRLEELNQARRRNAAALSRLLADDTRLVLPRTPPARVHVWHQYTVLLPDGVDRTRVVDRMNEGGVECGVYYPRLVWDHEAYRSHPQVVMEHTPLAESVARRCLSLPVHPALQEGDLERVAATLDVALAGGA